MPDPNGEHPDARIASTSGTGSTGDASSATHLNPFDPARLRLAPATIKVKEHITTIAVRKPAPEWWVQAHPDDEYRILTYVLEQKGGVDRDILLVEPELLAAIGDEPCVSPRLLITSITRQNNLFVWPLKLPDESNKLDSWNRSAAIAVEAATGQWIRVHADSEAGAYKFRTAQVDLPPPTWPDLSFGQILQVAFRDHYIDKYDHPVLRKLRGES